MDDQTAYAAYIKKIVDTTLRFHLEKQFPKEHRALENETEEPCVLHGVYRNDFLD